MSDSTISFSKDIASTLGLSEAVLLEVLKKSGLEGSNLKELQDFLSFWTDEEVQNLYSKHNFLVLPGCEINTESGHVLVFGLGIYEFGMHKAEFLQAAIEKAGGAMIAAHPYRRRFLEEPAERP